MNMQETKRRKSKSLINTTFSAVAWTLLQGCLGKILTGGKSSNQHRISKRVSIGQQRRPQRALSIPWLQEEIAMDSYLF
jgi:hypothetical protein